jgi:quercetin dioxygenase-like cupin family protein
LWTTAREDARPTSFGKLAAQNLDPHQGRKNPVCYAVGMAEQPLIAAGAQKILSLPAETQFAPNGIVSRTLLRTANSRVVLFGFAEGQELTEHTSTQHALVQVLSGECGFSLAGQPHHLKTGDLLYMPPNLPHAAKATTKLSMLLTLTKPELPDKVSPFNLKKS